MIVLLLDCVDFQWEKKNKKMKHKFEIDERDIKDVKKI